MIRLFIRITGMLLLLSPLLMWLAWLLKTEQVMDVFILDKTVLNRDCIEHKSLNWILTHEKVVKLDGHLHKTDRDYYGFFPLEDEQFNIRDLDSLDDAQIERLSRRYDMAYIADTYGIYTNEWYRKKDVTERSPIVYGGLKPNEAEIIRHFQSQNKLVIMEFNSIASPTSATVRNKIETLYRFNWSGWTGRYFTMLDTLKNPELPRWIVRLYKKQHDDRWPFTDAGIVFVHVSERVEILEQGRDLLKSVPEMHVRPPAALRFGLPEAIEYPYWFDIVSTGEANDILADYYIFSNARGDSILHGAGIPKVFPAILEHLEEYPFYYFAGDFADNPTDHFSAKFRWIEHLEFLLFKNRYEDRRYFFWKVYRPLVSKILTDYAQHKLMTH